MGKIDNTVMSDILARSGMCKPNALDEKYVIITKLGLYAPDNGKVFHDTYEQAWKHWYNDMNWVVKGTYKRNYALTTTGSTDYWKIQMPLSDTQVWNMFKSDMVEEYDFNIIQWKYAKGDVCR